MRWDFFRGLRTSADSSEICIDMESSLGDTGPTAHQRVAVKVLYGNRIAVLGPESIGSGLAGTLRGKQL
jgi:hypothetical protein